MKQFRRLDLRKVFLPESGMSLEFEAIDARCEGFTLEEREIGRLDPIG